MTILDMIYTILLGPLELVFEIIYVIANRFIGHPGLAIVALSLIMNFLVLPLYKRSDAMQEAARDIEVKLHDGVAHIKKSFNGDEQMMILQTYYRQNDYKPTDALNGSVSLLLEVPFFMAAYNFLSHLELIQGVALGPIADLGAPDAMLSIGGMTINVLPILMTLVNVVSSAIYLKGFPLKTKIQLYGMAVFFLIFLYTSPAGLVFYWTLNNVFSLVKTIFYKLKDPKKVLCILASIIGLAVFVFGVGFYETEAFRRKIFVIGMGVILQLPTIILFVQSKIKFKGEKTPEKNDTKVFVMGGLFLTLLLGALIPSTLIAASPQEFIDITYFYNPMWYIVSSLCLAIGTFLVWLGVFYWLASPKGKVIFDRLIWVLSGVMLVNYMFFGTNLGVISKNLKYENGMSFTGSELIQNILVVSVVAIVIYLIVSKWKSKITGVMLTAVIALAGMSGLNLFTIQESVAIAEEQQDTLSDDMPHFNLSKNGKNVIVLMLDRGMGQYIPYIMNEKPELKEQFAGFTYYSNALSFGGCTNFGASPLFGGYEYTPVEMNKRDQEPLVDKHNEALKVMPVLFSENNYDVTVCDPPYANYCWIPDLSIYDEYPEINTYITEGQFVDEESKEQRIVNNRRNFFCFSMVKTMPLIIQNSLYEDGKYNQSDGTNYQTVHNAYVSKGTSDLYKDAFSVLENMNSITKITDDTTNTFMMMNNNSVHEPTMLKVPEYEVAEDIDNTAFYAENAHLYTVDGMSLLMEGSLHTTHYQVNMAAMMKLGEWFDYLRENDVYDNTRIIIVSDHAYFGSQIGYLVYNDIFAVGDTGLYHPLLLVKDFDSKEFTTSDEFMTQADVPTLAVEGLIENPINPFTGKEINDDEKNAHAQYVIASWEYNVAINNGNVFIPSQWFKVSDDIWDMSKWKFLEEVTTMPEGAE